MWRTGPTGTAELAVIHRPKYDDWSLPKGKLKPGEGFREAALREVEEETGCRARLLLFAGITFYFVSRRPKVVLFWHMRQEAHTLQTQRRGRPRGVVLARRGDGAPAPSRGTSYRPARGQGRIAAARLAR